MDKEEFLKLITEQEKKILAIDFDGVIHRSSLGFHDGTVYDPPIEGSREALKKLSQDYTLIIYSCKANPKRPLINGKTGKELIWEWLAENKMDYYIEDVSFEKPNAVCYIDDKAIRFRNWESIFKEELLNK